MNTNNYENLQQPSDKKMYVKTLYSTITLMVLLSMTSCATNPAYPSSEELVEQGGVIMDTRELIGETGVTFVATNGGWFNYLGADGRKVVKVNETGLIKELTWRVNEAGEFCQQMFATEKEACGNLVLIKDKNGIYNTYDKATNKPGLPFKVVSGNSQNL